MMTLIEKCLGREVFAVLWIYLSNDKRFGVTYESDIDLGIPSQSPGEPIG